MDASGHRALRELLAKQAIADNLALHSRGVDRADLALLRGAYQPDATVAYGLFEGAARDFTAFLVDLQNTLPSTLHRTSNTLVRVQDADRAISESYVIAYMESPGDAGSTQRLIGGRYLDHHRRVAGEWRLQHRTYVLDWNINHASREIAAAFAGPRGAKRSEDLGQAHVDRWLPPTATNRTPRMSNLSNDSDLARDLDLALSRQALQELVAAYCRGVDRADAELLDSVFHSDARVAANGSDGPSSDFVRNTVQQIRGMQRSFHAVANEWFRIDGDRAVGECYVIAVITTRPEGDSSDMLIGGRYIDRFERRDGIWKIAERVFMQDWNMVQPTTAQFDDEFYGSLKLRGAFAPDDPIYAFWK